MKRMTWRRIAYVREWTDVVLIYTTAPSSCPVRVDQIHTPANCYERITRLWEFDGSPGKLNQIFSQLEEAIRKQEGVSIEPSMVRLEDGQSHVTFWTRVHRSRQRIQQVDQIIRTFLRDFRDRLAREEQEDGIEGWLWEDVGLDLDSGQIFPSAPEGKERLLDI